MDLVTIVVIYCFLVAALFLAMWIFYDRRDYALFDHERRKSTFLCVRCEHLYAAAGSPEECPCPKCGHENARLKY
ncbi:hydrogenase nickel incorporation protein HypA [Termitidicoccus mucosus]|uniref:Hydrogenase nickel incorporation protein HypA n=1 Tax=Termitidicoccus mucosus TaxID=1184151 RepID=A0A178IB11_9BACT|nr:hydrogenase nickel incorporation protein HypA [Opitutaceae bacterium TSB47]